MGQKIGSIIAFFITSLSSICASHVMVKIVDQSGMQVRTVGVGVPFEIQVVVDGNANVIAEPVIETEPRLSLRSAGTSTNMTTINGATSIKKIYTYQTRCQQEGVYTIGPVQVACQGTTISSAPLQIKATLQQQAVSHDKRHQTAFIQLTLNKKHLYVGEKTKAVIRFYYADERIQLDGIANPDFSSCYADVLEGPLSGSEVKDGIVYRYLEWTTELFPTKAGIITLPAIEAHIVVSQSRHRGNSFDLFSIMDEMMGGGTRKKTIYSNAVSLQVKPLPAADYEVQAVGNFTKLTNIISAEKAMQGEGVVYTLELLGSGNFEAIEHPSLVLPDGLSVYESNVKIHDLGSNLYKKDFEYIIQGTVPGNYAIDQQIVPFFDPVTEQYKTVKTHNSLHLQITPGVFTPSDNQQHQEDVVLHDENKQASIDQVFPLLHVTQWRGKAPRLLSWWWFIIMSSIMLIITIMMQLRLLLRKKLGKYTAQAHYYFAAKNAKKALQEAQSKQRAEMVYDIFIHYFSDRLGVSPTVIDQEYTERILIKRGMEEKTIEAWRAFFADVCIAKFSSTKSINDDVLYALAREWIVKLEKYV